MRVHVPLAALVVALSAPLAAPAQTDSALRPALDPITTRTGRPDESLVRLRLDPDLADALRGRRSAADLVRNYQISRIGQDALAESEAVDDEQMRSEGWNQFSFWFGMGSAGGAFAETALEFGGLSNTNAAMTNLGLLMLGWQLTLDLSRGDNMAAGQNAWRGMIGYTLGRFGTSALQIANVGMFLIDQSLQAVGTTAWAEREANWRDGYRRYYTETEAAQTAAQARERYILTPTLEERVAAINARTSGGRTLNDWRMLLWHYYREARNPGGFRALLEREVTAYVARFWDDEFMESYLPDGLAAGSSLTDAIRARIEAEHRRELTLRLARDVLPDIAARAWILDMQAQAATLTAETRDELNARRQVVVTAFGLDAPTQVSMPRPGGGAWQATLQPGQTRVLELTNLALMRAGFPDTLRLAGPDGPQEASFSLVGQERAVVVFGQPQSPNVLGMAVTEGPQSCVRTRRQTAHPETPPTTEPMEQRAARAPWVLHMSGMDPASGSGLMGQYTANQGWTEASMVSLTEGQDESSPTTRMSEPFVDGLSQMQCRIDMSALQSSAAMAEYITSVGASLPMLCTFTRSATSLQDGVETRETCQSQAEMHWQTVLVRIDGDERFVNLAEYLAEQMGDDAGAITQGLQGLIEMPQNPGGSQ
ncbi:MAG: hypothetical protein KDK01_07800 [Rhodobacteraceae bacterium]|nr:hypothetical protein [Paracoccaceae bacterium]